MCLLQSSSKANSQHWLGNWSKIDTITAPMLCLKSCSDGQSFTLEGSVSHSLFARETVAFNTNFLRGLSVVKTFKLRNVQWFWCKQKTPSIRGKGCLDIYVLQKQSSGSVLYRPATLLKKETLTQVFSCDFVKFLRVPFLQNTFILSILLLQL